jgi:hypothetical protein
MRVAKHWIKTWFFDVESHLEFEFSKDRFYAWLDRRVTEGPLSEAAATSIKNWLIKHVFVHGTSMWLNSEKLTVCGLEGRCTSIGKALHASLKTGADKVQAGHQPHTALNKMANKVQRKGRERDNWNAYQVSRNLVSDLTLSSQTSPYLTFYIEKRAHQQWIHGCFDVQSFQMERADIFGVPTRH